MGTYRIYTCPTQRPSPQHPTAQLQTMFGLFPSRISGSKICLPFLAELFNGLIESLSWHTLWHHLAPVLEPHWEGPALAVLSQPASTLTRPSAEPISIWRSSHQCFLCQGVHLENDLLAIWPVLCLDSRWSPHVATNLTGSFSESDTSKATKNTENC